MNDRIYTQAEINSIYKIHRDFAEHENNLINQRMTWLITVQSFLMATFGFSFQKYFEIAEKIVSKDQIINAMMPYIWSFKILFFIFAFVGIFIAKTTIQSVQAAMDAIENVGQNWDDTFRQTNDYSRSLPAIVGVNSSRTRTRGNSLSLYLPKFFFWLWVSISVLIVFLPPAKLVQLIIEHISVYI